MHTLDITMLIRGEGSGIGLAPVVYAFRNQGGRMTTTLLRRNAHVW